jgi:hypothetical protein
MARLTAQNVALAKEIIGRYPRSRSALIPLLHVAQQLGDVAHRVLGDMAVLLLGDVEKGDQRGARPRVSTDDLLGQRNVLSGETGHQRPIHEPVIGRPHP